MSKSRKKGYSGGIFYHPRGEYDWEVEFVVTQEFFMEFVEASYKSKDKWTQNHKETVVFQETQDGSRPAIALQFAEPSSEEDKWVIEPTDLPPIFKDSVDHLFSPRTCNFQITWTGKRESASMCPFVRGVNLKGAKPPSSHFTLKLPNRGSSSNQKDLTELLSVIESLKKQSRSVKFRQVKLILTGNPRVGKTTLKKRITGVMEQNLSKLSEFSPSSGLERPCVVQVAKIKAESAVLMVTSKQAWKQQKLEEELSTLFSSIMKSEENVKENDEATCLQAPKDGDMAFKHPAEKWTRSSSSQPVSSVTISSLPSQSVSTQPSQPLISPPSPFVPSPPSPTSVSSPSQPQSLPDMIRTIAGKINWEKAKERLASIETTAYVYIMDTGGQPEFHEVLPRVLQGQALHLVLFSLQGDGKGNDCLDRLFEVKYVSDEEQPTEPYRSVYPVKAVLFQILSSFHSLYSENPVIPGLKHSLHTPRAILVGTYKDKLLEGKEVEVKKRILDQVNQKLIDTFKVAAFYKSFLTTIPSYLQCVDNTTACNSKKGYMYVAMDNMYGTVKEMNLFRDFLVCQVFDVANPVELPCSVLLFHLLLRHEYEDRGTCTLKECKQLAEKCEIPDGQVTQVLKYLHITLGTILYYEDVPSLSETVICDPNVLLSPINRLIAVCFTCEPAMKVAAESARKTGVIVPKLWEFGKSCERYQGSIKSEQVLDFLCHNKLIIDCCSGMGGYFMPCLLLPKEGEATIKTEFLKSLRIWPLLIRFRGNTVPLGQFTSLVVQLCQKPGEGGKLWELSTDGRYRNQVTFLPAKFLKVKLTARLHFIEVVMEGSRKASEEEQQAFCFEAKQRVEQALKDTKTGHKFYCGCYCPGSLDEGQNPHYAEAVNDNKEMSCSEKSECDYSFREDIPPESSVWFQDTEQQSSCSKSKSNAEQKAPSYLGDRAKRKKKHSRPFSEPEEYVPKKSRNPLTSSYAPRCKEMAQIAAHALRQCWKSIVGSVSDPNVESLNTSLWVKEIYDATVREAIDAKSTAREKMNEMLKVLWRKINLDATVFDKFVETLKDSELKELADELKSMQNELEKAHVRKPLPGRAGKNRGPGKTVTRKRKSTSRVPSSSRKGVKAPRAEEECSSDDGESTQEASESSDQNDDDSDVQEVEEQPKKRLQAHVRKPLPGRAGKNRGLGKTVTRKRKSTSRVTSSSRKGVKAPRAEEERSSDDGESTQEASESSDQNDDDSDVEEVEEQPRKRSQDLPLSPTEARVKKPLPGRAGKNGGPGKTVTRKRKSTSGVPSSSRKGVKAPRTGPLSNPPKLVKFLEVVVKKIPENKWRDFGIALDIPTDTLEGFEQREPRRRYEAVFEEWVKCCGKKGVSPEWQTIFEALDTDLVGEGHLADQLSQR